MSSRVRLSLFAFVLAIANVVIGSPRPLAAAEETHPCHLKVCTVDGQSGACCMRMTGSIHCDPCGGFTPS